MTVQNYPLWTALITPFDEKLSIDMASFDSLLAEQNHANNGILLLGSTGESLNLSLDSKKRLVDHCLSTSLSVPVMVGVGGHDLSATLEWLAFLENLPIHAYLFVTPIYARPGDEGQYHWFKTLLDRVSKPAMLYTVPKRTGVDLSCAAVERLCEHANYWAIKDASGHVNRCEEFRRASNNRPIYCGDDGLFPDYVKAGGAGLVSVASNVWPREMNTFVTQCLDGSFDEHDRFSRAFSELFLSTNPIGVKRLLFEEKRIKHPTLMPPLSPRDLNNHEQLLSTSRSIRDWFSQL